MKLFKFILIKNEGTRITQPELSGSVLAEQNGLVHHSIYIYI